MRSGENITEEGWGNPSLQKSTVKWMSNVSFAIMIFALLSGAFIVRRALWKGVRAERKNTKIKHHRHRINKVRERI